MPEIGTWPNLILVWVTQPISEIAEFILRAGVGLTLLAFCIFWILKLTAKAAEASVWNSNIKNAGSVNSEAVVRMTEPTLVRKGFKHKQKAYLTLRQGTVTYDRVAVEIRKRKPRGEFVDGDIEVSNSAIVACGADIPKKEDAMTHITRVAVSPIPLGWDNLKLQTVNHPDFPTRLAWQMAIWSFVASTVAGVLISHFHMLVHK